MRIDSAQFQQRLDPVKHLPTEQSVDTDVPRDAFELAEAILNAAHPGVEFTGARRSTLAGGALYCAAVVLHGPIVTQDETADAVGTTPVSIRDRMGDMARVALEDIDLSEYTGTGGSLVLDRLEHLAAGGSVPELPGTDGD